MPVQVFTAEELSFICQICIDEDIILVTDEIYEHILFEPHVSPKLLQRQRLSAIVCFRSASVTHLLPIRFAEGVRVWWWLSLSRACVRACLLGCFRSRTLPKQVHICCATLPGMRERTVVVQSVSKTASATGWRIGWIISPKHITSKIRAVHDSIVIQAPTPLQKGVERFLRLPDEYDTHANHR